MLPSEAELHAIRSGLVIALQMEEVEKIVVFTDSIQQARRVVDPSVHPGQAHSLAVLRSLEPWLRGNKGRLLQFVYVPSSIGWGVHKEAHDSLKELPRIPGRRFESSIGEVKKWVDEITEESWRRNYWGNPGYRINLGYQGLLGHPG